MGTITASTNQELLTEDLKNDLSKIADLLTSLFQKEDEFFLSLKENDEH